MTRRTTSPLERIDMLLVQAERFREMGLRSEAIARAKALLRQAEVEAKEAPELAPEIESRKRLAIELIQSLGARVPDAFLQGALPNPSIPTPSPSLLRK
ncbi:MAG: hypothetical protein N2515_07220 [Deltaproteobacteria bacterium]|nr:hypothetical protein [Deltaproteobacteria bacterium]